jgi:hypothetical protein
MKNLLVTSILMIIALSCKDEDPKIACGCGGHTTKEVNEVKASYLGDGRFLIRLTNPQGDIYEEAHASCTIDNTWTKTADISNPDYQLTAKIKNACQQPGYSSYFPPNAFEITKIVKVL